MKNTAGIYVKPGILLIILLSFFTFSENFYPLLNSDMAVNILMTVSFSLPHDIYFWGQDRAGNLIPMIGHCLYMLTGWKPVILVSIVHYLILIAGFWALTRFVKTGYGRMVLALVWFFPPLHFLDFLLLVYGVQASCVLLSLNFLDRARCVHDKWKGLAWLSAACMMFIITIWVSELAVVSILTLLITGTMYYRAARKAAARPVSLRGNLTIVFCIVFWAAAGYLFLHYAKMVSLPVKYYNVSSPADVTSFLTNLNIVLDSVFRVFVFSSESSIESVFAWMIFLSLLFLVFSKKQGHRTRPGIIDNPWFYFFLTETILTLITVLTSSWVAANGAGRRYFTTFYMSAFISLVLWLENLSAGRWKNQLLFAFAFTVIIGSVSGSLKYYYPEVKPSRIRVISALRYMGNIGIIAEYWNAYLSASPDPAHIKATPHDKEYVRNFELAREVMEQPRIYIIREGMFRSFPDTVMQFGRTLKKKGPSFHLANSWFNRYEVIKK